MRAVFLDRDGTLCVGTPTIERVDSLDKVKLLPNTLEALRLLKTLDYQVFIITNQAGISEGLLNLQEFEQIQQKVLGLLVPSGIEITDTYLCPHQASDNCDCRKPKPKLLLDAAQEYGIDMAQSWMIGDRVSDVETGVNAGVKTILVKTGEPSVQSDKARYTAPSLLEAVEYIKQGEINELAKAPLRRIHREIVGGFIFSKDNKFLLGKTIVGGVYQDAWVVPGGGIEEGETTRDAVIREILEEVGIDIRSAKIEALPWKSTGQSEKVLRDTGERVLVDMSFNDFKVTLNQDADDVSITLDDDLREAQWFAADQVPLDAMGGASKDSLLKMGYIS